MRFTIAMLASLAAGLALVSEGANALAIQSMGLPFKMDLFFRNMSPECRKGMAALPQSPIASCVAMPALGVLLGTYGTSPFIPAVKNYITTLCVTPECAEADIRTSMEALGQACSKELASSPFAGKVFVDEIVKFLPTFKKMLCVPTNTKSTAYGSAKSYCTVAHLQKTGKALYGAKAVTSQTFTGVFTAMYRAKSTGSKFRAKSTTLSSATVSALACTKCAVEQAKILKEGLGSGPMYNLMSGELHLQCNAADKRAAKRVKV